jgi:peptide chain release factor 3
MGEERKLLDIAYPGDIVALFNPGDFRIGSTLHASDPVNFDVIPLFSPEHFRKASSKDPFKRKQLREGLKQLSEEGVVNVFELPNGVGNELLLGTVGALQFEVVEHRMKTEYKADIILAPTSYVSPPAGCPMTRRSSPNSRLPIPPMSPSTSRVIRSCCSKASMPSTAP